MSVVIVEGNLLGGFSQNIGQKWDHKQRENKQKSHHSFTQKKLKIRPIFPVFLQLFFSRRVILQKNYADFSLLKFIKINFANFLCLLLFLLQYPAEFLQNKNYFREYALDGNNNKSFDDYSESESSRLSYIPTCGRLSLC